jgi:DNA gyrase/topoisomerase IV subunit B
MHSFEHIFLPDSIGIPKYDKLPTRVLKRVTVLDAMEADKVFDILMGTDVPARKTFIQSNAKKATIDI